MPLKKAIAPGAAL
jgi:hypothetical protein